MFAKETLVLGEVVRSGFVLMDFFLEFCIYTFGIAKLFLFQSLVMVVLAY